MDDVGLPIASDCLRGISGAILCYGQTGSGKTHTMAGDLHDSDRRGLIPRILGHLFTAGSTAPHSHLDVRCSYTEVFNDKVRDLLSDGGDFRAFTSGDQSRLIPLTSARHAERLFLDGQQRRQVAKTAMNDQSSRSHTLLTLHVSVQRDGRRFDASVTLVDLAGSERMADNSEAQQREGININASLTALNRVFDAIITQKPHIPFNDTTLTKLLRPFLDPKRSARTVLIFHVSPDPSNAHDTRGTLKFAARCKLIKGVGVTARETALSVEEAMVDAVKALDDIDAAAKKRVLDALIKVQDVWKRQDGGGQPKRRRLDGGQADAAEEPYYPTPEATAPARTPDPTRLAAAIIQLQLTTIEKTLAREREKDELYAQHRATWTAERAIRDAEGKAWQERERLRSQRDAELAAFMAEPMPTFQRTPPRPRAGKENGEGLRSPGKDGGTPGWQSPASRFPLSSIRSMIEAKAAALWVAAGGREGVVGVTGVNGYGENEKGAVFDYVGGVEAAYRFPSLGGDGERVEKGVGGLNALRSPIRSSMMR